MRALALLALIDAVELLRRRRCRLQTAVPPALVDAAATRRRGGAQARRHRALRGVRFCYMVLRCMCSSQRRISNKNWGDWRGVYI